MQQRATLMRQLCRFIHSLLPAVEPENTEAPTLAGDFWPGGTVTVLSRGKWAGTRPLAYTYQHLADASDITDAVGRDFTIPSDPEWVGVELTCLVKAMNSAGFDTALTNAVTITVRPPYFQSSPSVAITGDMKVGSTATASFNPGGAAPLTTTVRWTLDGDELDDTDDNGTLAITSEMLAGSLTVTVHLANAAGEASATSAARVVLAADPVVPTNTVAPVLTGTPRPGETMGFDDGEWDGEPVSFAYQVYLNDAPVDGLTSNSFSVPSEAAPGDEVYGTVVATNAAGSSAPVATNTVTIEAEEGAFMAATGGTVTTDGDYKVHILTDAEDFVVTIAGDADVLIVGSAAAGGTQGGGGGGGRVRYFAASGGTDPQMTFGAGTYPVAIGAPGVGGSDNDGTDGAAAVFNGITVAGGKGGGRYSNPGHNGENGGGGGAGETAGGVGSNGGNDGGAGDQSCGGGAGEAGAGSPASGATGGDGGAGFLCAITGVEESYGAGGGGGGCAPSDGATGGSGGGNAGHGGSCDSGGSAVDDATAGVDGFGGGGGGGGGWFTAAPGKSGGLGTVRVRYRYR